MDGLDSAEIGGGGGAASPPLTWRTAQRQPQALGPALRHSARRARRAGTETRNVAARPLSLAGGYYQPLELGLG